MKWDGSDESPPPSSAGFSDPRWHWEQTQKNTDEIGELREGQGRMEAKLGSLSDASRNSDSFNRDQFSKMEGMLQRMSTTYNTPKEPKTLQYFSAMCIVIAMLGGVMAWIIMAQGSGIKDALLDMQRETDKVVMELRREADKNLQHRKDAEKRIADDVVDRFKNVNSGIQIVIESFDKKFTALENWRKTLDASLVKNAFEQGQHTAKLEFFREQQVHFDEMQHVKDEQRHDDNLELVKLLREMSVKSAKNESKNSALSGLITGHVSKEGSTGHPAPERVIKTERSLPVEQR